jgi:GR25 family glycosyltransferase involved in LPS biosynthesis
MKGYIIHLPKSKVSVDEAKKTQHDLKVVGIEPILFEGCDRYDVWQEFIDNDFKIKNITRFGGGYYSSEIATFISHFKLWKKCLELNENIMIFEHDAMLIKSFTIDSIQNFNEDLLNLGKPNWGKRDWDIEDDNNFKKRKVCTECFEEYNSDVDWAPDMCDCNTQWLFGAHSYLITPQGAKKIIEDVKSNGILPADISLNQDVLDIHDFLPHPFIQRGNFTLIQRKNPPKFTKQKLNAWDY